MFDKITVRAVRRFGVLAFLLTIPLLLTACGGAADDIGRALGRSSDEVLRIAEQRAAQQGRSSDDVLDDWARTLKFGVSAAQKVPGEARGVACGLAMELLLSSDPVTRADALVALQREVFSLNVRYAGEAFVEDLDKAVAAFAQGDSSGLFVLVLQTTSCQVAAL